VSVMKSKMGACIERALLIWAVSMSYDPHVFFQIFKLNIILLSH